MIPNPILKFLSTLSCHEVRYLLMGGQACVFYSATEFSRVKERTRSPSKIETLSMNKLCRRNCLIFTALTFASLVGLTKRIAADENSVDRTIKDHELIASQLRDAQINAAAKFVDLKIVAVEKGDFVVRTADVPVQIVFKEVWMHQKSAQVYMVSRESRNEDRKSVV